MERNKMEKTESEQPVVYSEQGGIAYILLNRPSVLNALDESMGRALLAACETILRNDSIRVVVLSGAGRAFMAGGDLARFHASPESGSQTAMALIDPLHAALAILTSLKQPVIGALHGAVAGAGISLALACDLAIASDSTTFNFAYTRIGANSDGGLSWHLPRIVGMRKAMEIALLGEPLLADDLLRLGLVNRVVPQHGLEESTRRVAEHLVQGPTAAFGSMKRLLRQSHGMSFEAQMAEERNAFVDCTATGDFREGVDAFFARRKPAFRGH
jgi:2-(1,2-epoxy-1,2-dihydrophenyl)acetyl-CoA isomerase